MASSAVHMAVTKLTAEKLNMKVSDRLLKGAVLPDFCADKGNSHLKFQIGARQTYCLSGFRACYESFMAEDDLYLGYYLHLVQDLLFRNFVYKKHHFNPHISGNVLRLHNDYRLINAYVLEKYGLRGRLVHPALKEQSEPPRMKDGIFFFTEQMADDFIQGSCGICAAELDAFFHGQKYMDEYEWAWDI
ncbi:MAG: hypothetical protein NC223_06165 [Butyrivibrio sp.]|nr:hypothetical protein [Butyrivibrio sp.]